MAQTWPKMNPSAQLEQVRVERGQRAAQLVGLSPLGARPERAPRTLGFASFAPSDTIPYDHYKDLYHTTVSSR